MPLPHVSPPGQPDNVPPPLIEFRNISKRFHDFFANRDICLNVYRGEIHAIVGENGAGKSTLMNVLFGRLRPDSGSLVLRGLPVSFRSPREAVRAGIGMVHQDLLYFPQLSVLENIILGYETGWPSFLPGILKAGQARDEINRIQDSLGFHLELNRQAKGLSFAHRQQIELVRTLYRGAEILILDEPTSLLSPEETERLLDLMKSLRSSGRTVLFISHRLYEVFSVADKITVLRGGRLATTLNVEATHIEEIARLMVGSYPVGSEPPRDPVGWVEQSATHQLPHVQSAEPVGWVERSTARRRATASRRGLQSIFSETHQPPLSPADEPVMQGFSPAAGKPPDARTARSPRSPTIDAPPLLELRDLRVGPHGTDPALRDVSISIAKGEILGIGGVVGNGQRSLARVLAGKTRPDSGRILIEGEEIEISRVGIRERLEKNIRWLPENLVEEALLPERPLWENFILGRQRESEFSRAGFIHRRRAIRFTEEQLSLNGVSTRGPLESLSGLSGGNRQKVALARIFAGPLRLAILERPCRGLDLHAAGAVYDRLHELSRSRGVSFVLISYDFDELISVCDRIAVIYRGEIMGTEKSVNLSRELFGRWAAGVKKQD